MKPTIVSVSVLLLLALSPISAVADQPHMTAALEHLQAARAELQKAAADKGGHRLRAMDLVDKAIAETARGEDAARPDPRPAR